MDRFQNAIPRPVSIHRARRRSPAVPVDNCKRIQFRIKTIDLGQDGIDDSFGAKRAIV